MSLDGLREEARHSWKIGQHQRVKEAEKHLVRDVQTPSVVGDPAIKVKHHLLASVSNISESGDAALERRMEALELENKELRADNEAFRGELAELKNLVNQLGQQMKSGGGPVQQEATTQEPKKEVNLNSALYDDCWVLIFRRLPLKRRIQLEAVCRNWKKLMPYTDLKSVDLDELSDWPLHRRVEMVEWNGMEEMVSGAHLHHVLLAVLSRCGPNLLQLHSSPRPSFLFGLNRDLAVLLAEKAPKLVTLKLSCWVLGMGCFPALARLQKLKELFLVGVRFMEDDFSALQDQEALKTAFDHTIQSLPDLKTLHLVALELEVPIRSGTLTELKMIGDAPTAAGVRDLAHHCSNLESLDLNINHPLDHQLRSLGGLQELKKLILDNEILHSADLDVICRGCLKLETLHLCVEGLSTCAELWRLPLLKHVAIFAADGKAPMNDAVLASLTKYGLLENVYLSGSITITNAGLRTLAQCPNLIILEICNLRTVTDEGMKVILEKCRKLEKLNAHNSSIGDGTMAAIGANGEKLRDVRADDTRVTDYGIRRLVMKRGERVRREEELVPLKLSVDHCRCSIHKEELDAVHLRVFDCDYDSE